MFCLSWPGSFDRLNLDQPTVYHKLKLNETDSHQITKKSEDRNKKNSVDEVGPFKS